MNALLDGPAVVLGVGNVLLHDDGVGVRVVEELRSAAVREPRSLPDGTRLVDGGTLGLELLRAIEGARAVLIVDAVDLDQPAGTVSVLGRDALEQSGDRARGIRAGVGELLAVGRLMDWLPARIALVGVQVADTGLGIGLSESVEAAVPRAVEMARRALRELDGQPPATTPQPTAAGVGIAGGSGA